MNDKLKEYIENCEKIFDFEIHLERGTAEEIVGAEEEYDKITRAHFKECTNPDGSGPNKSRATISKLTNGFAYIVARDKKTGEICGAESFQIYNLRNQAIPAPIYEAVMKTYCQRSQKSYRDLSSFLKENKSKMTILETHRLMSWVRGYHLAAVMIYKLEECVRAAVMSDPDRIYIFFETVNQYSRKAFELNDFEFNSTRQMGSQTKYIGYKM